MPLFSANLSYLFSEVPFLERFEAAAQAGFKNVEFMFPYEYDPAVLRERLAQNALNMIMFNLPIGDWEAGGRGLAADPNRREEFRRSVPIGIEMAHRLNVKKLNCLVGTVPESQDRARILENLEMNIGFAADRCRDNGIDLMLEQVNHFDVPGFFLNRADEVMEIIKRVGRPNVYLQYDIYHGEREGEDHARVIDRYLPRIAHIHLADVPGRNQPATGKIPLKPLLEKLDSGGYQGAVGLEYIPLPTTAESFGWIEEYGFSL